MGPLPTIGDIRGLRSALNRLTYLVGRKAEQADLDAQPGAVVPFAFSEPSRKSTASLGAWALIHTFFGDTLETGTYRLHAAIFAQLHRSVATGGAQVQLRFGVSTALATAALYENSVTTSPATGTGGMAEGGVVLGSGSLTITVPDDGTVIAFDVLASNEMTAGTAYVSGLVVTGWYQKIA